MVDTALLTKICVQSLENSKAIDIQNINMHNKSDITDFMIICTGNSNRHVCAIADRLVDFLAQNNIKKVIISGQNQGQWVLVDIGGVIVHILQNEYRERYALDELYKCIALGQEQE